MGRLHRANQKVLCSRAPLSFHRWTAPTPTDTQLRPWARIPSYGGNFSKKTFKFPTSQTIDKSQRVIELKRELHWKWNRNGLLEVSKGFVGCNAGHSRDNYSSVCWTCIESAQRSKSYSIKLIWRCSKRVQWPNSKISLTKYSSLVSQDLWANTYLLSAVYGVSIVWYNMIYREMHGCETMKVALYSPCCHRLLTALAIYVQYMCIAWLYFRMI